MAGLAQEPLIADGQSHSWIYLLPKSWQAFAQLSRYDRPVGFWLLVLPCWIGLFLATLPDTIAWDHVFYAILFALGALAMRGAGCTYNDIVDRDIDAKVARTANRPLAARRITLLGAWIWLLVQGCIGLGVFLLLPRLSQWIALAIIPVIALYPFMKRVTFFPQAVLGLAFGSGAPIAYSVARNEFNEASLLLYAAMIAWIIGYDTIYALQDIEDDIEIGVKSTARAFGERWQFYVRCLYFLSVALLMGAFLAQSGEYGANKVPLAAIGCLFFGAGLFAQIPKDLRPSADAARKAFASNQTIGLGLVAILVTGQILQRAWGWGG